MDITKIPIIGQEIKDWKDIKEQTNPKALLEAWGRRWKEKPLKLIWITIKWAVITFVLVQAFLMLHQDIQYCTIEYEYQIQPTEMRFTTFLQTATDILKQKPTSISCTYKPIKAWKDRKADINKLNEFLQTHFQETPNFQTGYIQNFTLKMEE